MLSFYLRSATVTDKFHPTILLAVMSLLLMVACNLIICFVYRRYGSGDRGR
jgi:hypothetical protein